MSPDTIIPGTSSQSLNRYSYVLNNPINANDPSGHKCNGAPEECLDNSNKPINGADWGYSGDLSTSSDPSQPSTIDSEDAAVLSLYNVYLTLWGNKDGWWWDQYGSGGFTIWEFMAVMWAYEQHGFPNTPNYAAALSNHAAWLCGLPGYSCDLHTAEGALEFMMEFSQVIPDRAECMADPTCGWSWEGSYNTPPQYWPDNSMLIVQGIRGAVFSKDPNALFNAGNVSLRSKIFKKMAKLGMIHTVYGLKGQDPMILLTYCQNLFMEDAIKGVIEVINRRTYTSYCPGG